jgi:hypothetical protein
VRGDDHERLMREKGLDLEQAEKLNGTGEGKGTVLVALPNCLWKISKGKHLAFTGKELRFLSSLQAGKL